MREDSTIVWWMGLIAQVVVIWLMAGPPVRDLVDCAVRGSRPCPSAPYRPQGEACADPCHARGDPWVNFLERAKVAVGNKLLRTVGRFLVAAVVTRT